MTPRLIQPRSWSVTKRPFDENQQQGRSAAERLWVGLWLSSEVRMRTRWQIGNCTAEATTRTSSSPVPGRESRDSAAAPPLYPVLNCNRWIPAEKTGKVRCRKGRQQQEGLAPSVLHWRSPQARGWEGCSDTSELCPPSSLACWEGFSIETVSYSVGQAAFQLVVNSRREPAHPVCSSFLCQDNL